MGDMILYEMLATHGVTGNRLASCNKESTLNVPSNGAQTVNVWSLANKSA